MDIDRREPDKPMLRRISDALQSVPRDVVAFPNDYAAGHVIDWHDHERAQVAYPAAGVLEVETADGAWVVPPQRALWLPAGVRHRVRMHGRVAMRSLYLRPAAAPSLPGRPAVLAVSPLLRELILRACAAPRLYDEAGPDGLVMRLLAHELHALPLLPLHLPMPADRRLRRVCEALAAAPGDDRGLDDWGRAAGASGRTLARLFRRETGLGFAQWRQQARLLAACRRLGAGEPVTGVALALGYDSASAFSAMFRRATGVPPSRYLD